MMTLFLDAAEIVRLAADGGFREDLGGRAAPVMTRRYTARRARKLRAPGSPLRRLRRTWGNNDSAHSCDSCASPRSASRPPLQ